MNYYQQSSRHVLEKLGSNESAGLDNSSIEALAEKYGPNILKIENKVSPLKLLVGQFKDILLGVLVVAATVSLVLALVEDHGSFVEPILIYCIVLAIAVIGFLNEYKAEKTVEALRKLVGQTTKVRRSGEVLEIAADELVPGDIVLIEEGQKVPADIRLVVSNDLKVNESSLTGESIASTKSTEPIKKDVALGDRTNMLFSGTVVNSGSGVGVVTAIGLGTELGKIADMVSSVEEQPTPMQKKLDELGRRIASVVLVVCIVVFLVVYFANPESESLEGLQRITFAFTAAVALAVAAIPEGLAFVVRISLALGARRMADNNALVRRLSAVEALGSTDIICSDKTGTLTKGEMTVRQLYVDNQIYEISGVGYGLDGQVTSDNKPIHSNSLEKLLLIGRSCNNSQLKDDSIIGDPTEGALLVSAAKYQQKLPELKRIFEIPFSSDRKMMSTVHRQNKEYFIATKGATDYILKNCDRILVNGKVRKITSQDKQKISAQNDNMATQALRVLAFSYKITSSKPTKKDAEANQIFVGLQAMMDPPRKEVKDVMSSVQEEAGMRVIMITGDHLETAKAVAKEIGIKGGGLSGAQVDKLSDKEFKEVIKNTSIFARVNPSHKIKIVQALKATGYQVAMTGDGVNDAPAVKAADIGIAMGITGTDATKEAADLILLDDQFVTIIKAIEEGRGIFDNVRKFVNYLLSANLAEVISILGGVVAMGRLVLSASQLLFINIVTDGVPAVALGSDRAESDIMRFKPKHYQGSIINFRIWGEMITFGLLMSAVLLVHFWYAADVEGDLTRAVSVAFVSMVVYELVRLITIRTDYKIPWFSNPWLTVSMVVSMIIQLTVIYFPPAANLFGVKPILAIDWMIISVASVCLLLIMKLVDHGLDNLELKFANK